MAQTNKKVASKKANTKKQDYRTVKIKDLEEALEMALDQITKMAAEKEAIKQGRDIVTLLQTGEAPKGKAVVPPAPKGAYSVVEDIEKQLHEQKESLGRMASLVTSVTGVPVDEPYVSINRAESLSTLLVSIGTSIGNLTNTIEQMTGRLNDELHG